MSISWERGGGLVALLVAAAALAHGLTLVVPFQFDDLHQIALNRAFREIAYWPSYFTNPWVGSSTGHGVFYRPLLFTTFLVDGLAGGGAPLPYRITSLAMLVLLAWVVRRYAIVVLEQVVPAVSPDTVSRAGAVAGLLVVVHPLFNETVLLASSRSSLMMAIFGVLALTTLLAPARTRWAGAETVLLTVAALLTKETAVVLAPLAVLTSLVGRSERTAPERVLASWPVVVPVALYVIFHETVFQGWVASSRIAPFPTSLANTVSPLVYPAQGGLALFGFARLFWFPLGLSLVHDVPAPEGAARVIGYAVWPVALAAGIAAVRAGGRRRLAGLAVLWFVIALAPTLVLVRMNAPLAEHRAVIAAVMPLIVVALALSAVSPARPRGVAVITLGVSLALASLVQTLPWRSAVDLWTHEARAHPGSFRAWGFLADALYAEGDFAGARHAVDNALRLAPRHPIYLARAAAIELATGNPRQAAEYTRAGLAVEPNLAALHLVEAERLALAGDLAGARVHAETVTRLAPTLSAGWNAKGNVLYMQGHVAAAVGAYRRALEMDPDNTQARANLQRAVQRSTTW